MLNWIKEKSAKAKAQREQIEADRKVCMKEIEKSCRAGSVNFGLKPSMLLKKDEELIFALRPGKLLEVKGEVREGSTVSIIDEGEFILTNKRLIFSGEIRTLSIALGKIRKVRSYDTKTDVGVCIKRKEIYKISCFAIPSDLISTTIPVDDRTYEVPFTGEQMVWLIKGAIGRSQ